MDFEPLLIGAATFLVIGAFHPLVIWTEYFWGARAWPAFLALGLLLAYLSLAGPWGAFARTLLAVVAFSSLWSIGELKAQRRRVEKGWFPENPARRRKGDGA